MHEKLAKGIEPLAEHILIPVLYYGAIIFIEVWLLKYMWNTLFKPDKTSDNIPEKN